MKRSESLRTSVAVLIVIAVQVATTQHAVAETIARQLHKQVPKIVSYLNERNLKTVGILKFRVVKAGKGASDSVGPLNSLLADRLEIGLILGNPFDETHKLNIIENASAQVGAIDAANHLSAEGRAAFFGPGFKLAWGNESLTADAFLTGIVQVHDDNRHVTVGVLCFDKNGGGLERACDVFEADLDASTLSEMGESFTLRGAFDSGSTQLTSEDSQKQKQQEVLKEAAKVKTQVTSFPLADSSAPVKLEIT